MPELRRLATIGRLARGVAANLGLTQQLFAVSPDLDDANPVNRVRMVYKVNPEFGAPDEVAELERLLRAPSAQRDTPPSPTAIDDLADRLKNPSGGIL